MNVELYEKMLKLLSSFADQNQSAGAEYPSDDCPSCGANYGEEHKPFCLCLAAFKELEARK